MFLATFFSIFCPSKLHSKFCIEKMTKKMRKSRILAFQSPPKTLPKSFQNRCPKKHTIFHSFLTLFFLILKRRNLENINFTQVKSRFLRFSLKSCFCNCHAFSVQKTYQKPFQNDARTLQKSMSKTSCFSTSIFSGFGLDLGASWGSKWEPKSESWF